MIEERNCFFECGAKKRPPAPISGFDCSYYPKPHDIDVTTTGTGCTQGIADTIHSNYVARVNAKKSLWFPIIQSHCLKYNELSGSFHDKDVTLSDLQYQLCLERCEQDNCLIGALNEYNAAAQQCLDDLETSLLGCDEANRICIETQGVNCLAQYNQCRELAYSAFADSIHAIEDTYDLRVAGCIGQHSGRINDLPRQIEVCSAEMDTLDEQRKIESKLRQRAIDSLVAAYSGCLSAAETEAQELSHPSPVPSENCIITIRISERELNLS